MTSGAAGGLRFERRFLLPSLPKAVTQGRVVLVEEHHVAGTRLVLRRSMSAAGGRPELTIGQHVRSASDPDARVTLTLRLPAAVFAELVRLPGTVLVWRRYDVRLAGWPCGVSVFEGELHGLVLVQAAFPGREQAARFPAPMAAVAEVTADERFAEAALLRTTAGGLARLVAGYGLLPA